MSHEGAAARRSLFLFGAVGIAVLAVYASLDPADGVFFPPCGFHALTGWLCPGCGGQRALHALLRGRISESWQLNPLILALVTPAALYLMLRAALNAAGGPELRLPQLTGLRIAGLLAVGFLYMLWRNMP